MPTDTATGRHRMIRFSFLIPTRARIEHLGRLLDSIVDTTARPDELEIVLGIDEDDRASRNVTHARLRLTKATVPPASSMGALNTACFAASSGRFVMLLNDDVVLRTKEWDLAVGSVFAQYDDDVAFVHVNDLLFRQRLCTFPFLSRRACLEIGVCPVEYQRYRIDDHIHDTYHLLGHLGYRRMTYLDNVVFEHQNWSNDDGHAAGHLFRSTEAKVYVPDQVIIERDARLYDRLFGQRKNDAVRLARLIDETEALRHDRGRALELEALKDPSSYRRPESVARGPSSRSRPEPSVTVAMVTADLFSDHAQQCLARLKQHTDHLDLLVLDNNRSSDFNHPREMNRAMRSATSDFLVLLDDDVLVEDGWVEGLLSSMDDRTGVVAPLHRDGSGQLSFSGVYLMGDSEGTHAHHTDTPDEPRACQALCSALLLIDLRKCRGVGFSESFFKHFLDLDYSFRVWEAGYQVVCTPLTIVTHLAGATMPHGSIESQRLWNRDLRTFKHEWVHTGRLAAVQNGAWRQYPFTARLVAIPEQIGRLAGLAPSQELTQFEGDLRQLVSDARPFPLFRALLARAARECVHECLSRGDQQKADACGRVLDTLHDVPPIQSGPVPILIEAYLGYNIVEYDDRFLAIPLSLGQVDVRRPDGWALAEMLSESTLAAVRATIDALGPDLRSPLLVGSVGRHNLVAFQGKTYAVPQWLGPVDLTNPDERTRPGIIVGEDREILEGCLRQESADPLVESAGDETTLTRPGLLRFLYRRIRGFEQVRRER